MIKEKLLKRLFDLGSIYSSSFSFPFILLHFHSFPYVMFLSTFFPSFPKSFFHFHIPCFFPSPSFLFLIPSFIHSILSSVLPCSFIPSFPYSVLPWRLIPFSFPFLIRLVIFFYPSFLSLLLPPFLNSLLFFFHRPSHWAALRVDQRTSLSLFSHSFLPFFLDIFSFFPFWPSFTLSCHPLLLRSFLPSFPSSFLPSFLYSFLPSFPYSVLDSFLPLLLSFFPSFTPSFFPLFLLVFPSFLYSFLPLMLPSFLVLLFLTFLPSYYIASLRLSS